MSLPTRLSAAVTLLLVVATAAAGFATYRSVRASLEQRQLAQMRDLAGASSAARAARASGALPAASANPTANRAGWNDPRNRPDRDAGYVEHVQPDGSVTELGGAPGKVPVDAFREVIDGTRDEAVAVVDADGTRVRAVARRGEAGVTIVAQKIDPIESVLTRLRRFMLALVLVVAVLGAALSRVIAQAVLRPVRALRRAAVHVTRTGDLSLRIGRDRRPRDDLERLGVEFDRMLAALDDAERRQRRLVEDASHELRTPLTSVRVKIGLLAEEAEDAAGFELDDDARRELLADVQAEMAEVADLLTDLTESARGTAVTETPRELDLAELVGDVARAVRRSAPDADVRVTAEPVLVVGREERLRRGVRNLLDNAVKFAGPAGPVEVDVGPAPAGRARVAVRDHGVGFGTDDLARVFERFHRGHAGQDVPGSGLGLSIVAEVAREHGGDARAANADGGGAVVELWMPAADVLPAPAVTAARTGAAAA